MEGRDLEDFDLGPEEHQLVLDEVELNSEQQRKIKQLQSEKLELQAEVESLTRKVRVQMTFRTVFFHKISQASVVVDISNHRASFSYSLQSNISDLYSPLFLKTSNKSSGSKGSRHDFLTLLNIHLIRTLTI